MAVDEVLLEGHVASHASAAPTLRLYGWRPAALSLGRFQQASTAHDPSYLRENGIDLVRRPSGGGAVLHEYERTYAVVGRLRGEPFPGSVLDTYRAVARALCSALGLLGLVARAQGSQGRADRSQAACFGAPSAHEIEVAGLKLAGSAQLRRRGAFLQHGSLLLRADAQRLARAIGLDEPPQGYTDLTRALGEAPAVEELDRCLVGAFEKTFSTRLEPDELAPDEIERATRLRCWKYQTAVWTMEGRMPPTRPGEASQARSGAGCDEPSGRRSTPPEPHARPDRPT
jgi:lipoate-protein ligase A